ncbi:response regulator [bacterium]|nr:response regulator [bacterium]
MPSLNGTKILLVEDVPDIRLLTRKVIEGDGGIVREADSIEVAEKLTSEYSPNLILLDLSFSGKSGFDFLEGRQKDQDLKKIPVIVLSGSKDKDSVSRAIALGANDYILKPFRSVTLLQKLRRTLLGNSVQKHTFEEMLTATFTLSADIRQMSEGGLMLECPVKIAPMQELALESELLVDLKGSNAILRSAEKISKYLGTNRYINHVIFFGINDLIAKKIRTRIKEGKKKT